MSGLDFNLFAKGGPLTWVLFALGLLGLMLFIERLLYLHRGQIRAKEFIDGIKNALAKRRLSRSELKPFSQWHDGRPETELNFKIYRCLTNKIAGISDEAATYLRGFF